jgi:type IV secretion system protein VirB6
LTGRTDLRVGDLPMIGLKIGAVVLLTTSWTTYQGLVFGSFV